jgi:hypothetical protein
MKTALKAGITGQDRTYPARPRSGKGYRVQRPVAAPAESRSATIIAARARHPQPGGPA